MTDTNADRRPTMDWADLSEAEQIDLRIAFGHYLDRLPPTCSPETRIARFRGWLPERGIAYRDGT